MEEKGLWPIHKTGKSWLEINAKYSLNYQISKNENGANLNPNLNTVYKLSMVSCICVLSSEVLTAFVLSIQGYL